MSTLDELQWIVQDTDDLRDLLECVELIKFDEDISEPTRILLLKMANAKFKELMEGLKCQPHQ